MKKNNIFKNQQTALYSGILFLPAVLFLLISLFAQPPLAFAQATGGFPPGSHCAYDSECASNNCDQITGTCQSGSTQGVAGDSCSTPGSQGSCIVGLTCCGASNTCQTPQACGTQSSTAIPEPSVSVAGSAPGGSTACPSPLVSSANGVCLPPNNNTTCSGVACSSSLTDLLIRVITMLLTLSGVVSVVFLIIGGFWYMTAAGNEEQAEKGKNTIMNFFLGLVIIIMAYAFVTIVNNLLTQGK